MHSYTLLISIKPSIIGQYSVNHLCHSIQKEMGKFVKTITGNIQRYDPSSYQNVIYEGIYNVQVVDAKKTVLQNSIIWEIKFT